MLSPRVKATKTVTERRPGAVAARGATLHTVFGKRPSLAAGFCFHMLLIGHFEGIDSERRIARRADSLALRHFLGLGLEQTPADHTTISRTRRMTALETHQEVFGWVLARLAEAWLPKGVRLQTLHK